MKIVGHERQMAYLERAMRRGRMSHAYLFYGPERVGKRAIAYAIARELLCPNRAKNNYTIADAGDDCHVCRQIDEGVYPDVAALGLGDTLVSKKETRKEIPIEDIRELKRRFSFTAAPDAWRIAIIDDADRMSGEASDAFLKLLEEPGNWTLFILIASSRDTVSATIFSRATPIGFSLVSDKTLLPFVRAHLNKESAEEILAIASGRVGITMELVRHPDRLAQEKNAVLSYASALKGGAPGALLLSEKAADDESMRERAIYTLIAGLRRQMYGVTSLVERGALAARIARVLDLAALMRTTNVNPRLALDAMFIEGLVKKS